MWADAGIWAVGHWITGRIEGVELDRLMAAILADLGIAAPVRIAASAYLDGYVVDRPMSARAALEPLAQLYGLDVSATAGTIRIRGPRRATPVPVAAQDLVVTRDDTAPLNLVRAEEAELPRSIAVTFVDGESADYRKATAAAIRPTGARRRETQVEAALVTRRGLAEPLADALLDDAIAGRDTAGFTVSPRCFGLEPGDVVALPGGAVHRVTRIADSPAGRQIETRAVPIHGRAPRLAARPDSRPRRAIPSLAGPPFAVILDLPVDRGTPTPLQYLAVAADPWPGEVAVWRSAGADAPLALQTIVDYPACLGETLTALPSGPLWRFDRATRLDVTLRNAGALSSIDEAAALAGGNLFGVVAEDGTLEILSAAGAELIGPGRYRLTRLLRGLAGSEMQAGRSTSVGSLIVRLDDGAVVPLVERLDETGRGFRYRIGPAGRDPGDPAFVELRASAGLVAFLPASPVHLRARREAAGVRLTWTRRARRDADAWEPVEIPLDEDQENYVVQIRRPDDGIVRTLTAQAPSLLYAAADEAADFGAPQTILDAAVAQVGALAGRGPSCRARVPVRAG